MRNLVSNVTQPFAKWDTITSVTRCSDKKSSQHFGEIAKFASTEKLTNPAVVAEWLEW